MMGRVVRIVHAARSKQFEASKENNQEVADDIAVS